VGEEDLLKGLWRVYYTLEPNRERGEVDSEELVEQLVRRLLH
jgi:hypothetical protein